MAGLTNLPTTPIAALGWIDNNIIGGQGWLQNYMNPEMVLSPSAQPDGSYASFSCERYQFICQVVAPAQKDINALDDFFEAYGYRVDTFAVPNLSLRSTFTYVKTRDCVVYSPCRPAQLQMAAMLNEGYKFWKGEIGK